MNHFFRYLSWMAAFLVFLAIIALIFGLYPVAIINGTPILAYEYGNASDIAYNFYTSSSTSTDALEQERLVAQAKKISLEGLIDGVLISAYLEREISSVELEEKTAERVAILLDDAQTKRRLLSITKASEHAVRTYFLEPQVQYQLLEERLASEEKDALEWLLEQRAHARVRVLLPGMEWRDNEIKSEQ